MASVLGRYPYGGSARTMIFAAPMICLLSGLGVAVMIGRLRRARLRRLAVLTTAFGLVMTGIVDAWAQDGFPLQEPPRPKLACVCTLVLDREGGRSQLVCVKSDLGLGFNRRNWSLFRSALFLCNRKDLLTASPPQCWDRLGLGLMERPLRCVLYNEWPENSRRLLDVVTEDVRRLPGSKPPNFRHQ